MLFFDANTYFFAIINTRIINLALSCKTPKEISKLQRFVSKSKFLKEFAYLPSAVELVGEQVNKVMLISRRVDVKSKVSKDHIAFRSPPLHLPNGICIPRVPLYVWLTKGLQTRDHSVVFVMLFLEHTKLWGVADQIKIKDAQITTSTVRSSNFEPHYGREWIQRENLKHGVQLQTLIHRTIFKLIWVQWSLYVQWLHRDREQAVSIYNCSYVLSEIFVG